MKISIITPSYNSEKTIEQTILSVQNQSYGDIEYIIVDGGSKDRTIDIVKKYQNVVTKWISEKDNGISDAFNKGINLATGEIIGIINSDDRLLPSAVEQIVKNIHSDIDVIYGDGVRLSASGMKRPYLVSSDPASLYKGMTLFHPGVFIRKSAYLKYGTFDVNYRCVMDRDLLLRMYSKGAKFQYINEDIAVFSMGGESDKNFYKYTLKEDYQISVLYGMNPFIAKLNSIRHSMMYQASKVKWALKSKLACQK